MQTGLKTLVAAVAADYDSSLFLSIPDKSRSFQSIACDVTSVSRQGNECKISICLKKAKVLAFAVVDSFPLVWIIN